MTLNKETGTLFVSEYGGRIRDAFSVMGLTFVNTLTRQTRTPPQLTFQ
jgi:hypothetical protein